MIRLTLALILLSSAPAAGWAQSSVAGPAHLSSQFVACEQRAGDNPVQKSVCEQREAGVQDDRLNKVYQRVMGQLASDPSAKATLRDEERRWIGERDYSCQVNGHTIDEACVVSKTAARADALEARVHF
jgi:uncharacterized protein YecT (DUF1311 family)